MASEGGGGGGGGFLQKKMAPSLSVIKIVKFCGVGGGGGGNGGGGRQNPTKIMTPPLCHLDSKALWRLARGGIGGGGEGC